MARNQTYLRRAWSVRQNNKYCLAQVLSRYNDKSPEGQAFCNYWYDQVVWEDIREIDAFLDELLQPWGPDDDNINYESW
jgi:arginine/lysine/ornithine decarboxylase